MIAGAKEAQACYRTITHAWRTGDADDPGSRPCYDVPYPTHGMDIDLVIKMMTA